MTTRPRSHRTRRGTAVLYLSVFMVALCGLISLGVDFGRVQLVKTELQRAADAAARYGISGLGKGVTTAQARAREAANENAADGSPVVLQVDQDVQFGRWSDATRTFTPLSGSARSGANAVRVVARRTADRGNPVPLLFARLLGFDTCDVSATATAIFRRGYTLVGIDSVSLTGVALIDSYNSANGPYSAATSDDNSVVVSNGDITLKGNPTIKGDAHPGPGGTIDGAANVTGSTYPLATPLVFPMPTVDPGYDNSTIASYLSAGGKDLDMGGNKTYTLPGGIYSVRNVSLNGTARLSISGDVTLYVSGNLSLSGTVDVADSRPGNFKIRMVKANTSVNITGNTVLHADLYAPGSTVSVGGTGDFYGTVVGKTLSVSGRAGIHYDESTFPYGGNSSGIVLVQ